MSETAKTVNRLMLTLLALGLFSLLAVGQPDAYLLNPAATVSVPSVGATSAKALLIVGPMLLIGVRIYLQIYVQHWRYLDAIADARKTKRAVIVSPMRHRLLRMLAGAVFYLLVPAALAAFTWKAMAIPKVWGYGLLIVTVFVSAAHLLQKWRREWTVRLFLCANIAAGIGVVGGAAFMEDLRRPFDLRFAKLGLTDLAGMDLRNADLRQAELNGADLNRARLRKAKLREAKLKKANLGRAQLQGAELGKAQLQEAYLEGAQLKGADLYRANLVWADLEGAQLQGANLYGAQLQGADLEGAQLQGAKLEEAQLEEADLSRTNFEGATGLTAESVENACYQPKTGDEYWDQFLARGPPINLPDGITIPPCKKAKEKNKASKK